MTNYVAEAIASHYGERCTDVAEGCVCCEVWKQFDALVKCAEILAGLEADDGGRMFPTKFDCCFARVVLSKAQEAQS